jgi:hypothetical protein
MDIENSFNLTPKQFIEDGLSFTMIINFEEGDYKISVTSIVTKDNGIYKLVIKGDYPRGSSVSITLSHKNLNFTTDQKMSMAMKCMTEYITLFVTEDYPTSLKKVAVDNKARENGWSLLKPGYEDYDTKVWEGFEDTTFYNDPYWLHDNGEIWRHTSMGYGPPIFKEAKPEDTDSDDEKYYPVVCVDCGEKKMYNDLQDLYDEGWFTTVDGGYCPEHASAAIEEEDNRSSPNNCLTYNWNKNGSQ